MPVLFFFHQSMQPWLSLSLCTHIKDASSLSPMSSPSCWGEAQATGPPAHRIIYLDMDRSLNISISNPTEAELSHWLPQYASEYAVSWQCSAAGCRVQRVEVHHYKLQCRGGKGNGHVSIRMESNTVLCHVTKVLDCIQSSIHVLLGGMVIMWQERM